MLWLRPFSGAPFFPTESLNGLALRLAFSCPKAGEELLLRRSSGSSSRGGGSGSGSRGSSSRSGGSGSSSGTSSRGGSGASSGSCSSVGGLRSFSSRLRSFYFRRLNRLRGFGFAASGHGQSEEGSYEERLLHFGEILNVMELRGQLVDRNVSISIGRHVITPGMICATAQQLASAMPGFRLKARSY